MKRRYPVLALLLCLVILCVPLTVLASGLPESSHNEQAQNYAVWASPVQSYLVKNGQGYLRVEYAENRIYQNGWVTEVKLFAEQYDENLELVSYRDLEIELPIFGGFYYDGTNYYLVFGQTNKEESNSKEILRVVKYDANWKKLGSASVKGANTTIPFDAGSLRMVHSGSKLFIHTCHEMYTNPKDGLNHQANMTYVINTSKMQVAEQNYEVQNINWGYVSHSFNQFVIVDGTSLVTLDHGDYYPRSAVLCKYKNGVGSNPLAGKVTAVDLITFYNDPTAHYNSTGASLGGLEASGTHYITVGNSCDQDGSVSVSGSQRNIYVTATSKSNFSASGTSVIWLTNYSEADDVDVSTPHLVKISSEKFLVLWTEGKELMYSLINGKGKQVITGTCGEGQLSDCKPIVANGQVIWYVTSNTGPMFYVLDANDPGQLGTSHQETYTYYVDTYPTAESAGSMHGTCDLCDNRTDPIPLPALSETDYSYTVTLEPTCIWSGTGEYVWKNTAYGEIKISVNVPAKGHSYTDAVILSQPGLYSYGQIRGVCKDCQQTYTAYIPWLTDTVYQVTPITPATCTQNGTAKYVWESEQFGTQTFEGVLPATGHDYETTVTEATCTENGVEKQVCKSCGHTEQWTTAFAKGHSWSAWDNGSRYCMTCGEKEYQDGDAPSGYNPFVDVKESKYYYEPILWAYYTGITTGKTANTFQPDEPCTRGQIVTFLWRAVGEPEPVTTVNPFTDVHSNAYYYQAVLWAYENGITTGKTATTFEPKAECTRAQVVTFLWRTMGKPAHNQSNPFADIPSGKYYTDAVLWALENGITTGKTATTFLPEATCTRGQIVTFLYRTLVENNGSSQTKFYDEYMMAVAAIQTVFDEVAAEDAYLTLENAWFRQTDESGYPVVVLECMVEAYGSVFTMYSVAYAGENESDIISDYYFRVNGSYYVSCFVYDYSPYSDYNSFLMLDTAECIRAYQDAVIS